MAPPAVISCVLLCGFFRSAFGQKLQVGGAGWALRFDGQNDLLLLDQDLPGETWTIDMWVQPLDLVDGAGGSVVSYSSAGTLIAQTSMTFDESRLMIQYCGAELRIPGVDQTHISTTEVDPENAKGQLFHYAVAKTPWNATIYLNGVAASELTFEEAVEVVSRAGLSPLAVGARFYQSSGRWETTDRNFGGIIDELRFWDVALTAEEVKDYMGRSVEEGTPGLFDQWKFDEGIGTSVKGSYWLGGGDTLSYPTWVPSPVTRHGGPVTLSARIGEVVSTELCALLEPPIAGATATVTLEGVASLGTLSLTNSILEETTEGAIEGTTRFCTSVSLSATTAGFENIPFTVVVTSPSGSFVASQNVSMTVVGNTAPSAGSAKAVQLNGENQYLSLGSWDPGEVFTFSLWVSPIRLNNEAVLVAVHEADGTNLFVVNFSMAGYAIIALCTHGCSAFQYAFDNFPTEEGSEEVLSTGLTANEVSDKTSKPHHVAMTVACISRGDASTGETAYSHIKFYQDGLLIGEDAKFPMCLNKPLLPESYADGDLSRPTPWEMGSEYDGGTLNEHQENVAVVPSQFLYANFDDLIFWKRVLTDDEVASVAGGQVPYEEDVVVHFTFDLDDEEDCQERQLWDSTLTCRSINEEEGRVSPSSLYPWTMAAIGGSAYMPSPFPHLRGSPLHRSMVAGTCANITLLGADADGDVLSYSLGDSYPGVSLYLSGDQLQYCDTDPGRSDLFEIEIKFDACDPYNACASSVSGLASAIFHVLPAGPKILAFQAVLQDVVSQSFLRLVFDGPTSCPTFAESEDIATVLQFSNSSITVQSASWETGCAALRVHILETSMLEAFVSSSTTVKVLQTGGLRDESQTSFPVVGTSPELKRLSCASTEVLLPGEVYCLSCLAGYVPGSDSDGFDECQPCSAGTAGIDSCTVCSVGGFSNQTGLTECYECPVGHSCAKTGMDTAEPCYAGYFQANSGSSSCERCAKGSFAETEGSITCTSCRSDTTTEGTGYTSASDCKCAEGYYRLTAADPCVECGRGASCLGFDADPEAAEGFMLYSVHEDYLNIFSCSETNRCPGGPVGTCAEGREGIGCATCVPGRTASSDGTCQLCSHADSITSIVVLVLTLLLLAFIYYRVKNQNMIRLKHETVLAMTTITQIILVLQLSSVLARLAIEWPEPLRTLMDFLLIFNFELDMLRVGCVTTLSDFEKYIAKLMIIPAAVLALSLFHMCMSVLQKEDSRVSRMRLVGAIGIFVSALYISLTSAIAAPLQCVKHPNERWTMASAEAVLCWEGGDHTVMLILGCIFLLIPTTFFGWMIYLMMEFPARMSQGDVAFLNSFAFLFMRVRPEARWFVIFTMARNGLIALIPVVPNAFWQCSIFICSFAVSSGVSISVWPSKIHTANIFEIVVCYIFQALGCMALPFTTAAEASAVPQVGMVLVILCLCLTPWMLIHWLLMKATGNGKAFRWFLCHHKKSAGSFARLLKLALTEQQKVSVFLDSDDLVDLNNLFLYVKTSVQTLTILCTKEVVLSPWCLGELAVARLSNVDVLPLLWPDFGEIEESFVQNVENFVVLEKLTENGLSLEDIRNGLRYLQAPSTGIEMPDVLFEASLAELVKQMKNASFVTLSEADTSPASVKTVRTSKSLIGSRSTDSGSHAILVDLQCQEAIAGGLILSKLLRRVHGEGPIQSFFVAGLDALVVGKPVQLPNTVVAAILLCTTGCFSSPRFLQLIVVAVLSKVPHILPAAASKDFTFPSNIFYSDLEATVRELCVAAGAAPEGSLLTPFVKSIFQKIFMHFFVLDSMTILNTQVRIVHDRLSKLTLGATEALFQDSEGRFEALQQIYKHSFEEDFSTPRRTQEIPRSDSEVYEV